MGWTVSESVICRIFDLLIPCLILRPERDLPTVRNMSKSSSSEPPFSLCQHTTIAAPYCCTPQGQTCDGNCGFYFSHLPDQGGLFGYRGLCLYKYKSCFPPGSPPILTQPAYSSILSFASSSSSPSSAALASLSASSRSALGTSWCRPLVGPVDALIHVISSSNSLSLLSS